MSRSQIGRPKNYPVVATEAYRDGYDRIDWGKREDDDEGAADAADTDDASAPSVGSPVLG